MNQIAVAEAELAKVQAEETENNTLQTSGAGEVLPVDYIPEAVERLDAIETVEHNASTFALNEIVPASEYNLNSSSRIIANQSTLGEGAADDSGSTSLASAINATDLENSSNNSAVSQSRPPRGSGATGLTIKDIIENNPERYKNLRNSMSDLDQYLDDRSKPRVLSFDPTRKPKTRVNCADCHPDNNSIGVPALLTSSEIDRIRGAAK